jgi:alpha-beta hydrolase superfamily lysophospholipase
MSLAQAINTELTTSTKHIIKITAWLCLEPEPKGIVHILHGMGEHKYRYQHFAHFLNQHHYHVYAHDHLGHGESIFTDTPKGHFGDENGFENIVDIVHDVQNEIQSRHANLPMILLGHSMGSFIAQNYLVKYPSNIQSLILSGSAYNPTPLLHALKLVASIEKLRLGSKGASKVLDFLSFGSFNNAFKPNRTASDWLSRDNDAVDRYIADKLCGFICSCASWQQLAQGMLNISNESQLRKIPNDLPTLIISGGKDPVGGFGKYVIALKDFWEKTGHSKVSLQLLDDARHEVLNETDKETTYNIILQWIRESQA